MNAVTNAIASLFADVIENGDLKLNQVPKVYRTAVKRELERREEARAAEKVSLH